MSEFSEVGPLAYKDLAAEVIPGDEVINITMYYREGMNHRQYDHMDLDRQDAEKLHEWLGRALGVT